MELDVIHYNELLNSSLSIANLEEPLLKKGIIGISHVPGFEQKYNEYIKVARQFSLLAESIKQQYAPNRDAGITEGYEIGVEWFKNLKDEWQIDTQKASYYACVPDQPLNKWPTEVNLKTAYLALGELIFTVGKQLLNKMGLNDSVQLNHELLTGYGRMLHYHGSQNGPDSHEDWCGAHHDHGLFTGLIPAAYFHQGSEIEEPENTGLYIMSNNSKAFEKVKLPNKSTLLFQVGEFGQLLSNDRFIATKHMVKKAPVGVERFTYALFYSPDENMLIKPNSILTNDLRYLENQDIKGFINYKRWSKASLARYRAK
ncbi:Uncharacterised protein [Legionella beliardensis]|uniref:Isopenicillin N synthase-like Fe(2+) 2OG dioxygenase domain-containing protein n=1 Tax=Legionella beliardensis TaxID=91822 RepID=A0A378HY46_9GAMM|nr:2OG-Fe(II) oxygenase family protein [Legionella beliardensis]STX27818.1 Uncharacterised protein [Legionella beliardensis]